MAVDENFAALFIDLKPDDPYLPSKPWESIPSESGLVRSTQVKHLHNTSSAVSEGSVVRLALNALQGSESAILSIEKIAESFCCGAADRTFHEIPNIWCRASSTNALGKMLREIGCVGSLVFLLYKFVSYFREFELDDGNGNGRCSLVNQAFVVAVGKVLGGYVGALETVCASVAFRRSGRKVVWKGSEVLDGAGCLKNVVHGEITLLEVYLHTAQLRNQMQSLANICKIQIFEGAELSPLSIADVLERATVAFGHFPVGASLLSYLYSQLEVAEPAHTALFKFLFQKSCEPYFGFIRQWIFEATISDPYNEFILEPVENITSVSPGRVGTFTDMPLATVTEREKVTVPCFLSTMSIPLFRAGQQLQVVKRMLEICNLSASGLTYDEIVPCFTSDLPFSASVLSFKKKDLEAMVIARNKFYDVLQSKLQKLSVKFHDSSDQVVPHGIPVSSGSQIIQTYVDVGDNFSSFDCKKDLNMVIEKQGDRSCSSIDEFSDPTIASDWSSSSCYDDDSETEQFIETPSSYQELEQRYLSSLMFSSVKPSECSYEITSLNLKSCVSLEKQKPDYCIPDDCDTAHLHLDKYTATNIFSSADSVGDSIWSWMPKTRNANQHSNVCVPFVEVVKSSCFVDEKKDNFSTPQKTLSRMILTDSYLTEDESRQNGAEIHTTPSKSWKLKKPINFLSRNPMLRKSEYFCTLGKDKKDAFKDNQGILSTFDFSKVECPFKGPCEGNGTRLTHKNESVLNHIMDSHAVPTNLAASYSHRKDHCENEITKGSKRSMQPSKPSDEGPSERSVGASGGGGWQKQLFNYNNSTNLDATSQILTMGDVFEMPVDFIINKCLLQEIKFQYQYISKLTIKLLKEGFGLQQHLEALRRYHLMGVADWADIFIMSLWHHKWCREEGEKRIPQIQSLLESSIQRSSCERDPLKDRVFVFTKQQSMSSLDGVSSFEFLGLGYRLDWPASIVVTLGALSIYSQIFNFLIQVKLANFALTDVWCSLKDLKHVKSDSGSTVKKGYNSNLLMKIRHRINHFVTSLQQYLLSQLSHVSWSRLLRSLETEVKDMMDFETVHQKYLTDCLQICFLSDGTNVTYSIIANILQCALDFRSFMIRETCSNAADTSCINFSQMTSLKTTFDHNLKELYHCHLKSLQHAEFGLHHFWKILNYNDFYSNTI